MKNRTIIEIEVKGREFRLECSSESTWEEVLQAITLLNSFANERINALNAVKQEALSMESPPEHKE